MRAYLRVRPLTDEEYQQLKRQAASRKLAAGRVKRAQVILLSNQGYRAQEIAERLGMHERTARTWINRFTRLGIPGLEEGPRTGRPPVYTPTDVGVVIQTSLVRERAASRRQPTASSWVRKRPLCAIIGCSQSDMRPTAGLPVPRGRVAIAGDASGVG